MSFSVVMAGLVCQALNYYYLSSSGRHVREVKKDLLDAQAKLRLLPGTISLLPSGRLVRAVPAASGQKALAELVRQVVEEGLVVGEKTSDDGQPRLQLRVPDLGLTKAVGHRGSARPGGRRAALVLHGQISELRAVGDHLQNRTMRSRATLENVD